jgi:hypothetical protein
LAVLCRVEHPAKLVILDSETFDVLHKALHDNSLSWPIPHEGVWSRSFNIAIAGRMLS